jgi:hypothetical protein
MRTHVPINGLVYSTPECEFLASPIFGQIGYRKNPGSPVLEKVIFTSLVGDKEGVWMNYANYLEFWIPLAWRLRTYWGETCPTLVRNIRQSRITTLAETSDNGHRI